MRKLSILIPAYNAQRYLPECLEKLKEINVWNQSQYEVIIVNDGSKDQTKRLLQDAQSRYSNLQVIHKKNEGVSVARNTALDAATGEYVFFLDADDYPDAENWNYVDTFLNGIEEADFIGFTYETLYADGTTKEEPLWQGKKVSRDLMMARRLTYASSRFNTCWGKLFRRSIIEEYQIHFIPGMKIGEDAMFVMEYMTHCKNPILYNLPILFYRQVSDSAMHASDENQKLRDFQILYAYRKKQILKDDEIYEAMCREHFSVITNLMLQAAYRLKGRALRKQYAIFLKDSLVQEILCEVKSESLHPVYKKVEYILMKHRMLRALTYYFQLKSSQ